jgi:pyruvate,water dikinase
MSITDHAGAERAGFPSPFEVTIPPDCEGWEEMYARHAVFGEDRRRFEEGRFWFQDGLHAAEPLYPFDSIAFEYAMVAFNRQRTALRELRPSASSAEFNCYIYLSATWSPTKH